LGINFAYLQRSSFYKGINATITERYTEKNQSLFTNVSVLETQAQSFTGVLIRPDLTYSLNWGAKKKWRSGFFYRQEYNALHATGYADTLTAGSYHNLEGHFFTANKDTSLHILSADLGRRYDYAPLHHAFNRSTVANTATVRLSQRFSPRFALNGRATYRILEIDNEALTTNKPDKTALLHVDGNLNKWKNTLVLSFMYELLSGQEQKYTYTYVQVPPGQGVYTWIDYNHDGIKQLNEFEVAQYPDQATYIRVANLTNAFISNHTARAAAALALTPANLWARSEGVIKKWLSKWQAQTSVQSDRKTLQGAQDNYLNPFVVNRADTALTSANFVFNNGLYYNRSNPHWGVDGVFTQSFNQQLITDGPQSHTQIDRYIKLRITPQSAFITNTYARLTDKISAATLLTDRNYHLHGVGFEEQLSYQPTLSYRTTLSYVANSSVNTEADSQKAFTNKMIADFKVNTKTHSALQITLTYASINYKGPANTPVSYAMLDALQPGNNWVWNLTWDKKLSDFLNLTMSYEGRAAQNSRTVHTGRAQIRAVF
jgi:hypothetical protein